MTEKRQKKTWEAKTMNFFEKQGDALLFLQNGETVKVEPWMA